MTDDIRIEIPTEDDWDEIHRVASTAFHGDSEETVSAQDRIPYERERFLVARREDKIVGTAGIYTRRLAVPGATVPAAHVTFVSVAATARRQGVLTRFIRQQFEDVRAAGEPIAVLWASEGRIYQRFGYGLSTRKVSLNVEAREVSFSPAIEDTGRLREGTPAEFRDTMIKLYDQVYADRPGWSERLPQHLDYRLADPERERHGASGMRVLIHEGTGGVDGYVLWRVTGKWDDNGPAGEARIIELVSATTEAYAAMWRFMLTVDLARTTTSWIASVDEPLQFMVNEPRRLGARISDGLWLRVVDVPAALAARRYATDIDVVLEITDELVPANAGRWRLTGSATSARCESTVDEPDLACDVRALGAAYLGGTSLQALAASGIVHEVRPGTLAPASIAFGWHRTPAALEMF